jgi:outer membrane receptor protein involved in Fe transport
MIRHPLTQALLLAILVPTVHAASDPESGARQLDEVRVTATRVQEAIGNIPTALTVLTREDLERNPVGVMAEHLRGQPGAFIQRTGPGQGIVIVRGLKGSEVLHLVDGFRLNNAFFRNAPNQYMALVDPYALEQVELTRGAASTLFGSDAMGGVLQLRTATPRFRDDGAGWSFRSTSLYSSHELERTQHARVDVASENLAVSTTLTWQELGQYQPGGDVARLRETGHVAHGGGTRLLWRSGDHELGLALQSYELPRLNRYNELVRGFGSTVENQESVFEPNRRRFAQLRYQVNNLSWADTLELMAGQQIIDDDRRTRGVGASFREFEDNSSELTGLTGVASRALGDHQLTLGFDFYRDEVRSSREREVITSGTLTSRPARFPDGSVQRELGLFLNDDWRISEQLDLIAGLRWTRYGIDLPAADRGVGIDSRTADLTGQLGLTWAFADDWKLAANLGRGFRAPNVFDYSTLGDRPGNRFNEPNAELGPETVVTGDLGLRYFGEALSADFTVFATRYRDRLVSVDTGRRTSTGRIIVRTENIGQSRLHGFESGLRWELTEDWRLRGALNWTWAVDELDGGTAPANRTPPLNGRIEIEHQWSEAISLGARTSFAARQDRLAPSDLTDNRINPRGTGGYAVHDLSLRYAPPEQPWEASLDLDNLFDKAYREHGSGIDGVGRGVVLRFSTRFDG